MEDKKNNQVMYESELGIMSTLDKSQQRTIIRAIGVGGGGIHAVNHMYLQGIEGVTFVVLDTDCHLLDASPVPNRVLLRSDTTRRSAAEESESEIAALYDDDTKLVIFGGNVCVTCVEGCTCTELRAALRADNAVNTVLLAHNIVESSDGISFEIGCRLRD